MADDIFPAHDLRMLTADIVSAHVANNDVRAGDVASLIGTVYQALASLGTPAAAAEPEKPQAATTARKSLSSSTHIVSMIDGKPYKMLRRHIGQHGYTPESYRRTFGLAHDYPMVARDYAEIRRALAHKIGLGRKPGNAAPTQAAKPRGRKPAAEAAPQPVATPGTRKPKALVGAISAAKEHLGGA